jgi:hypothetical protein
VWGTPPFTRLSPLATTQTSPANAVIAPPEWRAAGSTARARDERYPLSKTAQGRALVVLEPYAYAQSQMDESSSREPRLSRPRSGWPWVHRALYRSSPVRSWSADQSFNPVLRTLLGSVVRVPRRVCTTRSQTATTPASGQCFRRQRSCGGTFRPAVGRATQRRTSFRVCGHPLGLCPAPRSPRSLGTERGMVAFPLSAPRWWLACDLPSDKVHSQ